MRAFTYAINRGDMMKINIVYNIDSKAGIKIITSNTVHSIVTDPPYELGFMGKDWIKQELLMIKSFGKSVCGY